LFLSLGAVSVRGISRESAGVFFSIDWFSLLARLRLSLLLAENNRKRQKKKRDDVGFFIFSSDDEDDDERRHLSSSALRFRGSVDDSFSSPSVLGRCEERTGFFFCDSRFER